MPCPPPATEDGRGYVNLCPTNVADGADQARRVIVTTNRLVILSAEAPQVAALAKVLWAGIVEMILDLVIQRMEEWVAPKCGAIEVKSSAGIPFRRCEYNFGRGFPAPVASALFLHVNQGMGDRCVAVFRDLDHHSISLRSVSSRRGPVVVSSRWRKILTALAVSQGQYGSPVGWSGRLYGADPVCLGLLPGSLR